MCALQHGSAAVIIFHNHPSGLSEPSQADIAVTRRLQAALALIDVKLLDHLIVAERLFSFSQAGLL
jgi:DNA repair protein RadC